MLSKMTKDGEDWVTMALDPFHDIKRNIEGLPDQLPNMSFVRTHVQTLTLDLASNGQSNVRIQFHGFHGCQAVPLAPLAGAIDPSLAPPVNWAWPIAVRASQAGTEPSFANILTGATITNTGFVTTPTTNIPSRLIAIGIEVHDITPKLYQQGTVAVVRCPGAVDYVQDLVRTHPGEGDPEAAFFYCAQEPALPSTQSLMASLPGYLEWEAAKGIYTVGNLIEPQKPAIFNIASPGTNTLTYYNLHPLEYREIVAENNVTRYVSYPSTNYSTLEELFYMPTMVPSGFEPFVINMTGLNTDSGALRITCRTIVEYFPETSTAFGATTCSPSPAYDPAALEYYYRVASHLPGGVPVDMNAKGDYWRMVANLLRRVAQVGLAVAPPLLTALGQPALGQVVKASGMLLAPALRQKKKKPAPKKRPNPSRK